MAATTARFTGSPVRAASRSTTWIQRRPLVGEPSSLSHRIVAVDGLAIEVPLVEPDASTAAQVDGRVEVDHRVPAATCSTARTKLPSSARPTALDFSGWNWVAHSRPRSTAAVIDPP